MKKMMQLYRPGLPSEPIQVGNGRRIMAYRDWLESEAARIMQRGDRVAEVREGSNGKVSLWVDRVVGDDWKPPHLR